MEDVKIDVTNPHAACDPVIQLEVEKLTPSRAEFLKNNRVLGVRGEPGDEFLR